MSGISKIFKKVKKIFKKIVKVIKKIVKSKIFKAVLIGAALYFGGAALLSGAGSGAGAGTLGAGVGSSVASGMPTIATYGGASVLPTVAANTATTGVMGTLTGLGNTIGAGLTATGKWAAGNQLLASTALNMGGGMLSGAGAEKAAEEKRKREEAQLLENNSTHLDIANDTYGILQRAGYVQSSQEDAKGLTVYDQAPSPIQRIAGSPQNVQNVENKPPQYFNNSSNKWQQVS